VQVSVSLLQTTQMEEFKSHFLMLLEWLLLFWSGYSCQVEKLYYICIQFESYIYHILFIG
jgi:hypothetical protein